MVKKIENKNKFILDLTKYMKFSLLQDIRLNIVELRLLNWYILEFFFVKKVELIFNYTD